MDAVAAEAGVGKGTLFRRFGDRARLARAVLSEYESELQDEHDPRRAAARPGRAAAGAPDRVRRAYVAFLERHGELLRSAEGSHDDLLASAPYAFYRTHIALLLREAGLRRPRGLPRRRRSSPRWRPPSFRYLRAQRELLAARELVDAHADLCTRLLDSTR